MWYIILIDLQILKNFCIPGMKSTFSWCMIFLICCCILFARIFLRIFASMFISDIGLQFSFFVSWLFIFLLSLFQMLSEKVLSKGLVFPGPFKIPWTTLLSGIRQSRLFLKFSFPRPISKHSYQELVPFCVEYYVQNKMCVPNVLMTMVVPLLPSLLI